MTLGQMLAVGGAVVFAVFCFSAHKTYKEEKAKQKASAKIKQKTEEKEEVE